MAQPVPLQSGREWDEIPGQHVLLQGGGISPKKWLRDTNARGVQAVFKFAEPADDVDQMYSLGFERVGYALAMALDLPVPDTHLESFDRRRGAVQILRPNADWSRHWALAEGTAMWGDIRNRDLWPLCVAFDLWIANTDRHIRNVVFEAIPPDVRPWHAAACTTWLPDHGWGGLYPPSKFRAAAVEAVTFDAHGRMTPEANARLRDRMPPEYLAAFTALTPAERQTVLDAVKAVPDDAVAEAVRTVPQAYFTQRARRETVHLLKARRDAVDILAAEVF